MNKDNHVPQTSSPKQSNWYVKWTKEFLLYGKTQATKFSKYYDQAKVEVRPGVKWAWKAANADLVRNESATAILTILILVATCVYAYFAYLQWDAMNGQLGVMSNQLGEMKTQNILVRQQLIGTQAAILRLDLSVNTIGEVNVVLQNTGHVSAIGIHFHFKAWRETIWTGKQFGSLFEHEQTIDAIPPATNEANIPFQGRWLLPWHPRELTRLKEWPKNWPGNETTVIRGEFTYQNGFGDRISHPFCGKWLPGFTIKTKEQSSGGGGSLFDCDEFLSAIRSIEANEKKAEQEK